MDRWIENPAERGFKSVFKQAEKNIITTLVNNPDPALAKYFFKTQNNCCYLVKNANGETVACKLFKENGNDVFEVIGRKENVVVDAENASASSIDNLLDDIDNAVNTAGKFSLQQIDEYVTLATQNKSATKKVMLGKYLDGGPNSYIQRAGSDHTYFDMGATKWKEAEALVGKNADEMWKINKEFIDRQKALNKEFYFSQEPWKAQTHEYLSKEAEYLIDLGAKDFQKINADTWKVIW